jgi:hypothetical protein
MTDNDKFFAILFLMSFVIIILACCIPIAFSIFSWSKKGLKSPLKDKK